MPKIINPSGLRFENAKGGPYKYGIPLKCTRTTLQLIHQGKL